MVFFILWALLKTANNSIFLFHGVILKYLNVSVLLSKAHFLKSSLQCQPVVWLMCPCPGL